MLVKVATFLALAAVCFAFPAEGPEAPVVHSPVEAQPAAAPTNPEDAADLQTDNTFWYGGGHHHRHHYPVYRSYYVPRSYSYYSYYEPYHYSSWW